MFLESSLSLNGQGGCSSRNSGCRAANASAAAAGLSLNPLRPSARDIVKISHTSIGCDDVGTETHKTVIGVSSCRTCALV